jgi:hypothetical protein
MVEDYIDSRKWEFAKLIDMLLASDWVFEFLRQDMFVRSVTLITLTLLFLSSKEFIRWFILNLIGFTVIVV